MSEQFLYMTAIGRVSGKPHRIEIWFVEHEACYYLCCGEPENSNWLKNIKKTPQVQFHIREREQEAPDQDGIATVLEDATILEAVKAKFREKYNWDGGLMVQICPE